MHRLAGSTLLGLLAAIAIAGPVVADPAGPTDYRSEIVGIDPPTSAIELRIIGGDSFLELEASPGTSVMVIGYQGEDYLRFEPDGSVLENRNSPSTYTNDDRFGGGEIPPNASVDAEPDWRQIASDHRWAWHDHRIHWMQRTAPLGRSPGDQILEAVIPLEVDDDGVDVTVVSVWQPAPSPVPAWVGAASGLAVVAGLWALRGSRARYWLLAVPTATALAVGAWQFRSLPTETGPRVVWWLLPAIAAVCATVAIVAGARGRSFLARSASVLVAVELAIWGWIKRDGFGAALIPTDAPGWLDRFAVAASIVTGVGTVALMSWELFVTERRSASVSDPRVLTG